MYLKRRKPEALKTYKTLYRGSRLWAVLNRPKEPVDGWTGKSSIVIWDSSVGAVTAVGNFKEDNSISGEIVWGQGVSFLASDIKGMVATVKRLEKEYV